MTHRFLQFLQQSKFGLERVAILSEDQTAFGAWRNPSKGEAQEKGPIYLYYPRDIATLRAAYSQQSIFSAGKNQSAPSSTLRGDLGGAASSKHDSVHTYSGDLTPLAQEATLFGIVNVLKSKRIDFVVIRSSNSLDQLFLAEFLRRSYPGGRVVLDGADLLFRRGIEGAALRGLMMLSTYPLLSWTQDEIRPVQYQGDDLTVVGGPPPTSYRIFGSYLSEGAYIAARGLFKADKKNGDTADKEDGPNISDYGPPPFGGQNDNPDDVRPATWLTVVGHGQFWPIAVLNDDTLSKGGSFDSDNKAPDNASTASLLSPARPPANPDGKENDATSKQLGAPNQQNDEHAHHRSFPAETTALMLFCWALALAHCYLCWTGSMIGTPRMRAYFAPIPLAEQPVLIFIGSLLLGALGVTFAGATGLMNGFYSGFFLWAGVWCMAGLGLIGLLKNYSLPLSGAIDRQPQEREQAVSARRELARAAAAGSEPGGIEPEGTTLASQQEAWSAPPQSEPGSYTDDSALASESTKAETKALGRVDSLWSKLLYARDALAGRQVRWWKLAGLWMVLFAGLVGIRLYLNSRLTPATANAAFWRNSHITNGVSALLPQVLLILGMYAWFWYNLRGLSLFGEDRPVLPGEESLPELFLGADNQPVFESQNDRRYEKVKGDRPGQKLFSMFSADEAGMRIERAARPLSWSYCKPFVLILGATILFCALLLGQVFVLTLVDRAFGIFVFFVMCVAIAIILSDTLRFASAWSRLRQLLVFLDRLRLRRTLARLKGLSWTSVLSMSGNVLEERYRLMSRQLESVRNLQTALVAWHPDSPADAGHQKIAERELGECEKAALSFAEDYAAALSHASPEIVSKLKSHLAAFQKQMAKTAGCILTHIILPSWQREGQSLVLELESADKTDEKGESRPPLASDAHVQAAEEFFVLSYLGFIQNILGALRTVVVGILLLFTATTLALSSYPFSPAPMLGAIFLALFLIVGATVVFVYAEMHRDATLSHITQTRGELGFEFYTRIFSFGIGPLIGLLTTLFPSITDFVVSWLQPGAETIR